MVVGNVLDAVADAIQIDEDMQIYTSGATNIFKYPELSDKEVHRILSAPLKRNSSYRACDADACTGREYRNSSIYR